jgi:hypothetical protein
MSLKDFFQTSILLLVYLAYVTKTKPTFLKEFTNPLKFRSLSKLGLFFGSG